MCSSDLMAVCEKLAENGVILVPGTLFDINPEDASGINKTCVRISFAAFPKESWRSQIDSVVEQVNQLFA